MKNLFCKLSFFVLPLLVFCGCQKEKSPVMEGEPMEVSLSLKGDFNLDITQESMTKASSADAYAINVYYDKESDGVTNDMYAYGLFDNVADMTITMLSNHKYKVECTLVKDAKNKLYFGQAFGNTYTGYAYPFQTNVSNSTLLNNKFIIGTETQFTGMGSGNAHIITTTNPSVNNSTPNASVNRFYGVTDQYEPVPNGTIEVYLKRVVFGAKFVVTGVKEGTLNVACGAFFNKTYSADDAGVEQLYTFSDVYTCWEKETPFVTTINLQYTSDRPGDLWDISKSQDISFKRNVMTTVNVKLNPDLSGALFEIVEEPFDEENTIDLGINTDGYIDIVVKPEN